MRFSSWFKSVSEEDKPVEACLYTISSQTLYILLQMADKEEDDDQGGNNIVSVSSGSSVSTAGESETATLLREVQQKIELRRKLLQQGLVNTFNQDNDSDAGDGRTRSVDFDYYSRASGRPKSKWCKPAYIPTFLLLLMIILVVLLPLLDTTSHPNTFHRQGPCQPSCRMEIVESIPIGLKYTAGAPSFRSTYEAWKDLLNASTSSIDIASYYWTLKSTDVVLDPSSDWGNDIFEGIKSAAADKKIEVRIAQNLPSLSEPNFDTDELTNLKLAEVRSLNFTALMGGGVLHTKFWIVDRKHFYIGSANMDWRSLTQVKELGIVAYDCPCLAADLTKIFLVYWALGGQSSVPDSWPESLATGINQQDPAKIVSDGIPYTAFISSSPPPFSPGGRTGDIDAILDAIRSADKFVHIAVMDYYPLMIYKPHFEFWPLIDDELRRAFIDRDVNVRLLVSKWPSTRSEMLPFLQSLVALESVKSRNVIEVKRFVVPTNTSLDHIPFARVNHNKYMITDKAVVIGTSNWSGDYFVNTAGVSLVLNTVNSTTGSLHSQIFDVFERDWESEYATSISFDEKQ